MNWLLQTDSKIEQTEDDRSLSLTLTETVLITHCGIDIFGPFVVKQKVREVKRYAAMFTYLHAKQGCI